MRKGEFVRENKSIFANIMISLFPFANVTIGLFPFVDVTVGLQSLTLADVTIGLVVLL
jgi:hypothetical protein